MGRLELAGAILATAEALGQTLSADAVKIYVEILDGHTDQQLHDALMACARELRGKLTPGEILARINDGRPTAAEAWANTPTMEQETIIWTAETALAYFTAEPLIKRDKVAANRAFTDAYNRAVQKARAEKQPIRWGVSLGTDPHQAESRLAEAVTAGKLTQDEARHYLPEGAFTRDLPQITDETIDKLRALTRQP